MLINKHFFKFLFRLVFIIAIGLVILFGINRYDKMTNLDSGSNTKAGIGGNVLDGINK